MSKAIVLDDEQVVRSTYTRVKGGRSYPCYSIQDVSLGYWRGGVWPHLSLTEYPDRYQYECARPPVPLGAFDAWTRVTMRRARFACRRDAQIELNRMNKQRQEKSE